MVKKQRSLGLGARACAFTLALGAVVTGCAGTRVTSGGPFSGVVSTPEGTVRYALSKSVVTVEATVTSGATGKVTFDGNDFSVDTKLVRKDATAEVSISTVPDEDQFFTLRLEHGGTADDDLAVEIAPNGTLRAVGVQSTSQIVTTAKNVVTVVASVAAAVAAAALSGDPRKEAAALVCEKLASDAGTPGRCPAAATPAPPPQVTRPVPVGPTKGETKSGAPVVVPARPAPKPAATGTAALPTCDARAEKSLAELSLENLYFLARSQKNRQLWQERRDAEARLQQRGCRRIDLERELERATSRDRGEAESKLAAQIQLENAARIDLRTASEELDAAVRAFQLETGIDAPARTEVVRMTFDLDELPPPDMLRGADSPDPTTRITGMTGTAVREALKPYPRVLELYDRTGIALTLTPAPYIARGGTVWETGTEDDPRTHIYYRPAYTAVLTTYSTVRAADAQGGEQEVLRFFSAVSDEVIHRKMPVQGIAFLPAAFAERRITLAFDEKGRLVRFEQAGKSSVAAASTAAADAVRAVRDEYAETLTRISDIQETQRQLDQNELITQIDRLRKQKDLVDARLELSGSRANYDLQLERKRIEAELAAAQDRDTRTAQRESPTLTREVADLRRKVEQLARDLEELKHRTDTTTPHAPVRTGR